MSLFSKPHYVWLVSAMRNQLHIGKQSSREAEVTIQFFIENLTHELEIENSNFDKSRFLHNIYCGKNHEESENCPYHYHIHIKP